MLSIFENPKTDLALKNKKKIINYMKLKSFYDKMLINVVKLRKILAVNMARIDISITQKYL